MSDERLWAPWRLAYVSGDAETRQSPARSLPLLPGADADCFLCRAVADDADRDNLVVRRGERCITVLNRFPYNNGHLLVAPRLHKAGLGELDSDDHHEIQLTLAAWVETISQTMNADGFNIGLNVGRAAGAGVPGHLHWHLVPRWNGDTNFMPVLGSVKVIPQSLDALWERLHE